MLSAAAAGHAQPFDNQLHQKRADVNRKIAIITGASRGLGANAALKLAARGTDLVLKSVFFLTQALVPLMADGGRILNVSSGLTRFTLPGHSVYASMKGAVEVLTRYLAKELGPRGIAVNTLAPGAIATDFGGGMVRDNPEVKAMIAASTALGRVGLPDDIGDLIASLVSDDLRWVNAQRIEASGGIFI